MVLFPIISKIDIITAISLKLLNLIVSLHKTILPKISKIIFKFQWSDKWFGIFEIPAEYEDTMWTDKTIEISLQQKRIGISWKILEDAIKSYFMMFSVLSFSVF